MLTVAKHERTMLALLLSEQTCSAKHNNDFIMHYLHDEAHNLDALKVELTNYALMTMRQTVLADINVSQTWIDEFKFDILKHMPKAIDNARIRAYTMQSAAQVLIDSDLDCNSTTAEVLNNIARGAYQNAKEALADKPGVVNIIQRQLVPFANSLCLQDIRYLYWQVVQHRLRLM